MNKYLKATLAISSIGALALGLAGCGNKIQHKTVYKHTPKTHEVHMILPSVPPKVRGTFLFNISSDDINELLHINQHYLYLRSGTNINGNEKKEVMKQIKAQYAGKNKRPSQAYINKQWLQFVKENVSNNQTHLKLQIHSFKQSGNKIIINGVDSFHHYHSMILHIGADNSIQLSSKYAQQSVGNLVKNMSFQRCSSENMKTVLHDDHINPSALGYK